MHLPEARVLACFPEPQSGSVEIVCRAPVCQDTHGRTRKLLKKLPNIAEPGANHILLFAGLAPAASNWLHVQERIQGGMERENYGVI